ncbi:winged helix-turn-helix domain-containing protein [Streptomyces sp. NPDC050738]|uniref:winged helix-turn-helix domain-containing protein n=1 Tax=Streptomyces sp. NPDC050738 TaxID=3154744 RepID=UPI003427606C
MAKPIHRLFGYQYTLRGVSYLLQRLGRSPQVPAHRAVERDDQARRPAPVVDDSRPARAVRPVGCGNGELGGELRDVEPHHGHVAQAELVDHHVGCRIELLGDDEHRAGGSGHDAGAKYGSSTSSPWPSRLVSVVEAACGSVCQGVPGGAVGSHVDLPFLIEADADDG